MQLETLVSIFTALNAACQRCTGRDGKGQLAQSQVLSVPASIPFPFLIPCFTAVGTSQTAMTTTIMDQRRLCASDGYQNL